MDSGSLGTLVAGLFYCAAAWAKINVSVILGPKVRKFPCLPSWFQFVLIYSIFSNAARGLSLLSSINTINARIVHWDVINGAFGSFLLWASIAYILHNIKVPASLIKILYRQYDNANKAVREAKPGQNKEVIGLSAMMKTEMGIEPTPPVKHWIDNLKKFDLKKN